MDNKKLIKAFEDAKPGFVAFPYTNKQNETSKVLVNIGTSYAKAKENDINTLENFLLATNLGYVPSEKYTAQDWQTALNELLLALKSPDTTKSQAQQDAYISVTENGTIKWCIETQELYIVAQLVKKEVLEEGTYKVVNSKPLTIAKNKIRKEYLTTGKYRHYSVKNLAGNIKISGDTLEIE